MSAEPTLPSTDQSHSSIYKVLQSVPRKRGRPRGSGRGRGRGRGGVTGGPSIEAAPAADEPAEPKRAIGEDLKENLTRPRRAAGRYDAGEAIVDTAPRRTSAEVQLAKINAQKTAEEAEAKAETHRLDQKRQIAALEDQLQRMDAVAAKHALRPDLVDHVPVEESSTASDGDIEDRHLVLSNKDMGDIEYLDDEYTMDVYNDHEANLAHAHSSSDLEQYGLNAFLQTSDIEDPPMGIIVDDSLNVAWQRPVAEKAEVQQRRDNQLDFALTTTAAPPIPTQTRPVARPKPKRGDLRREVGLLREVPETQVGPKIPTNTKRKDFAGNEDHVKVPGDFSAAKRPKVDAPAGLVPGWLQKINTVASKKNSVAIPADDADDEETGEFDADDSAAALAAARAAKKTMVKITAAPNNVTVKECSVMKIDGASSKPRREKFKVSDLTVLVTASHTSRWQKQFRHTLISWAGAQADPFGTNSLLTNEVVMEIWDTVYPDVNIGGVEQDCERNRGILICLCGGVLLDWRSSIGSAALTVLQESFVKHSFTTEDIIEYVGWAYNPGANIFNFIYKDALGPPGGKGGLQSKLIIEVLAAHIRKTGFSGLEYGHPVGGIGLSVAAVERALKLWASGQNPSPATPKMPTNLPGGMKRRPTKEPFAEEGWGARARNWVKTAERLGDADWTAVMGEVYKRMSGAVTED